MSEVSPSSPHITYTNNVIPMPERHPDSYEQIRLAKVSPIRFTERKVEETIIGDGPHKLEPTPFHPDQTSRIVGITRDLNHENNDRTAYIANFILYREQNLRRYRTPFTDILTDADRFNRINRVIMYGGKEGIAHLARLQAEAEQRATSSAELPPTS